MNDTLETIYIFNHLTYTRMIIDMLFESISCRVIPAVLHPDDLSAVDKKKTKPAAFGALRCFTATGFGLVHQRFFVRR